MDKDNKQIVEIDYEKLADSIVKANKKTAEEQNDLDKGLSKLTRFIFIGMGVFCVLFAVCGIYAAIKVITVTNWSDVFLAIGTVIAIAIMGIMIFLVGSFSWNLFKSTKDIKKEKDRNYIMSVFSSMVGFIALIVAIIALIKAV